MRESWRPARRTISKGGSPDGDEPGRVHAGAEVETKVYELEEKRARENERLDQFAGVVSHDLRSPLSVAVGCPEIAREDGDREAFDHGEHALKQLDADEVRVGLLDSGFYVADDGTGIPEANRAQVFRGGFSTARDGIGFGLALVREIAEVHGYDVTVTESDDGGARFEFWPRDIDID
ncbi:hypothetical protein BRC72_06185 [Halobacteriales archaeon QH_7_66_36]|nr:MAG: hypothetical protein BRC72_06185 [Halobacteriales archaeon QH_7_66_36]